MKLFKIDFEYRLWIFYKSLKIYGFGEFHPDNKGEHNLYYNFWGAFLLAAMLVEGFYVLCGIISEDDINKQLYGVAIWCTHILFTVKFVTYLMNRDTLRSVINLIEKKCYKYTSERKFFDKSQSTMYKVIRNYTLMTNISIMGYVYVTLTEKRDKSKEKGWQLVPMYIGHDFKLTENGTNVIQSIVTVFILLNGYYHIVVENMNFSLFIHIGGQFEAVANCFSQINYAGLNEVINGELRNAIRYHQIVLRCAGDLQNTFRFMFLAQIIVLTIPLCLTLWLTVTTLHLPNPPILNLTSHFMFMTFLLYQLYVAMRCVDNITHQALKVSDGVWMSDWYNANVKVRRCLALVCCKANTPLTFSALGLLAVNANTFIQVLKNAYAFFTLITKSNTNA